MSCQVVWDSELSSVKVRPDLLSQVEHGGFCYNVPLDIYVYNFIRNCFGFILNEINTVTEKKEEKTGRKFGKKF